MSEKNPVEKKKRRRIGLFTVGITLLLAAVVIYSLSKKKESSKERQQAGQQGKLAGHPVPVTTAAAHTGDVGIYLEALGTVTPVYTVNVISRVQGQITKVNYNEGQLVHPGDPLLEIDSRPYIAALTQAEGQLAHDQGLLKEAVIDLARYRRAYAHNAIPKQQLDDQEQVVVQDKGTVKADEGAVATAQVNLDYCHITSPIEGRVGLRLIDPGNMVQANSTTALVVVTQLHPMTVVFSISEDHLPGVLQQVREGHALEAEAYDRTQEKLLAKGTLQSFDNVIDTTTGTVKLKAVFPNQDDTLFPNQFVNIKLKVNTEKGDMLIATQAVQRNAQGPFVYVIKPDQTAVVRQVKTGTSDGKFISVKEGIKEGEIVATDGFDKLQDGAKISVHKELAGTKGTESEAP